jgi:K+-sensing histidine kinase KdpD
MPFASKHVRRWAPTLDSFWYIASMPLAIGAVILAAQWGFKIPNVPPALLLPLAYSAYRGGLVIGLLAALLHVGYSAIFFSSPGGLFQYDMDNLIRTLVIAIVAPSMATMLGILRRKTDLSLRQLEAAKKDLLRFTSELERRVEERTLELRHDSLTGIANRLALSKSSRRGWRACISCRNHSQFFFWTSTASNISTIRSGMPQEICCSRNWRSA